MAQAKHNSHADTDLVVGIDGTYIVAPAPVYDEAKHRRAFLRGYSGALTRSGQSAKKSGAEDWAKFLANPVADYNSDVTTIASMRDEIAREMCHAALVKINPPLGGGVPYNSASDKAQSDTVTLSLPAFMRKQGAAVEAALTAKLAAGYAPTKRGAGGDKTTAAAVAVDF